MPRNITVKTNFTGGEIAPELIGRGDLKAYDNAARNLSNVVILPTGGVARRAGFYFIDTVAGAGRLIAFEFNTTQLYLVVLTDTQASVYRGGVKIATLATPWTAAQIPQVTWSQSADTLLLCHPDVAPQSLTRNLAETFSLTPWTYAVPAGGARLLQPHYKFAATETTITPSATTGSITVTTSHATCLRHGGDGRCPRNPDRDGHHDRLVRAGLFRRPWVADLRGLPPRSLGHRRQPRPAEPPVFLACRGFVQFRSGHGAGRPSD
jgi:hypothetical protein